MKTKQNPTLTTLMFAILNDVDVDTDDAEHAEIIKILASDEEDPTTQAIKICDILMISRSNNKSIIEQLIITATT